MWGPVRCMLFYPFCQQHTQQVHQEKWSQKGTWGFCHHLTLYFESAGTTPSSTQTPWNWDVFYVVLWCVLELMQQTWNILSPIPVVPQIQACLFVSVGGILHFRWRCRYHFERFWCLKMIPFLGIPIAIEETCWHGWAWRICLGRMLGFHYENTFSMETKSE